MDIGIPAEIKTAERRVGMTPGAAGELTARGHQVTIQTGAGEGAGFSDADYKAVGVRTVDDAEAVFDAAEMIVKVKEPQAVERAYCNLTTRCLPTCIWLPIAPKPMT